MTVRLGGGGQPSNERDSTVRKNEFAAQFIEGVEKTGTVSHTVDLPSREKIGLDALQGSRRRPTGDAGAVEIQDEIHASVI